MPHRRHERNLRRLQSRRTRNEMSSKSESRDGCMHTRRLQAHVMERGYDNEVFGEGSRRQEQHEEHGLNWGRLSLGPTYYQVKGFAVLGFVLLMQGPMTINEVQMQQGSTYCTVEIKAYKHAALLWSTTCMGKLASKEIAPSK